MVTKITCMALLCLSINAHLKAQDLITGAVGIIGLGDSRIVRIKTVNQGKNAAAPIRIYVELHNNRDKDNPIGQTVITAPSLKPWGFMVSDIRLNTLTFRKGFKIHDGKRVVVITDPKNEVKETNESNNKSIKELE